jgi:hypothetical protein
MRARRQAQAQRREGIAAICSSLVLPGEFGGEYIGASVTATSVNLKRG